MATQIIPLTSDPNQTMQTTVNVNSKNVTLQLMLRYNETANYWVMTVSDSQSNKLVDSIPLITGDYPSGNILEQYAYLGIGSAFVIKTGGTAADYPGSDQLGTDFALVWSDTL